MLLNKSASLVGLYRECKDFQRRISVNKLPDNSITQTSTYVYYISTCLKDLMMLEPSLLST